MFKPMRTLVGLWSAALPLLVSPPAGSDGGDPEAARTQEGRDAFRAYLQREYPAKKGQAGPSRLDCPAVRAAYPGQRFYFVYSGPPLPPGAYSRASRTRTAARSRTSARTTSR
jgi:hypothetical protein